MTEIKLVTESFSLSTADDENNYFSGQSRMPQTPHENDPKNVLPEGTYRIINGNLCRILPGVAPRHQEAPR